MDLYMCKSLVKIKNIIPTAASNTQQKENITNVQMKIFETIYIWYCSNLRHINIYKNIKMCMAKCCRFLSM